MVRLVGSRLMLGRLVVTGFGIWWAINISSLGKCLGAGVLYWRKKWLHTEV